MGRPGRCWWRRWWCGLLASVLLAAACSDGASVEPPQPVSAPTSTPVPTVPAAPVLDLAPGWHALDVGPLAPRIGAAAVWTGDEVVVWGGSDGAAGAFRDGAAFDPTTGRWRELAPAPLPARAWPVAVWTGTEMVVVGGVDGDGRVLTGAVAYDPAADLWRELDVAWGAVAPLAGGVWTGERVVVVGAIPPPTGDPLADVVSIDGEQGFLDVLATFGVPERRGLWVGWDGSSVVTATVDDAADVVVRSLDPSTGEVIGDPVDAGVPGLDVEPDALAVVGTRLVVPRAEAGGAVVDLVDGAVDPIGPSGSRTRWPAVVVGDLVSHGDVVFDASSDTWRPTPLPDPGWDRTLPVVVGAGDRVVVWGGDACGRAASCSALVSPAHTLVWIPAG